MHSKLQQARFNFTYNQDTMETFLKNVVHYWLAFIEIALLNATIYTNQGAQIDFVNCLFKMHNWTFRPIIGTTTY
jgi:hypothetical protein